MARSNFRGARRTTKDVTRKVKKKPCALCRDRVEWVDYKDVSLLKKYMSDRGKIRSRRVTGNCAQHQRDIALAIKTARELVLLPYTQRTVTERPGGRSGRGPRDRDGGGRREGGPPRPSDGQAADHGDRQAPTAGAGGVEADGGGDGDAGREVASEVGS